MAHSLRAQVCITLFCLCSAAGAVQPPTPSHNAFTPTTTAKAKSNTPKELKYTDALQFRMINKGFENCFSPYGRIPASLQDSIRPDLWARGKCSAGLGIRFCTNSTTIGARYHLSQNFHMMHMADTGTKGTDLYVLDEKGHWHYLNTARPVLDSIQDKIYVENLDGQEREYLLYLPLYDGIDWLEIGVDSTAFLQTGKIDSPKHDARIVFYGTSIMQGGCASRTGMAATNILQRELGMECINWGFSGEGKMDNCMAREMAKLENIKAYVIDPVPNCTEQMCQDSTYNFIQILRKAHPETPIIMVEGPIFPYAPYDAAWKDYLPAKNAAFRQHYERLKKENPHNLYYVTGEGLNGENGEGTVDGRHLTDLGFHQYAEKLRPILEKAIHKAKR